MEDELVSTSVESFSNSAPCIIARRGPPSSLFQHKLFACRYTDEHVLSFSRAVMKILPSFLPLLPTLKLHSLENILFLLPGKTLPCTFCMLNSSPAITARHGKWLGRNSIPTSKWLILWKWNLLYNIAPVTAVIGKWKFCLRGWVVISELTFFFPETDINGSGIPNNHRSCCFPLLASSRVLIVRKPRPKLCLSKHAC